MDRRCEVCLGAASAGAPAPGAVKLRRVLLEGRIVGLCERHAAALKQANIETLAELRALFLEAPGKRSQLARRAPLDRRVFPARPEGRRMGAGRRATDID